MKTIDVPKKAIDLIISNYDYKYKGELIDTINEYNGVDNFIEDCCISVTSDGGNGTAHFRFPGPNFEKYSGHKSCNDKCSIRRISYSVN